MKEKKIGCSKCGGHIVFPIELAGQEIACPHCGESILLPKSKSAMPWIVAGVFAFITVCLASVLFWDLGKNTMRCHQFIRLKAQIYPLKFRRMKQHKRQVGWLK